MRAAEEPLALRPHALDLFCGQGGAGVGYFRAGWDVTGVDIEPQTRYPFDFVKADALTYPLDGFDFVHASPPCQAYSRGGAVKRIAHPDLIGPIRERLDAWGGPYVIENVELAPLRAQVMLCGTMFGLRCRKHRWFETNLSLNLPPADCGCAGQSVRGELLNFHNTEQRMRFIRKHGFRRQVDAMRYAYGMEWMSDHGLKEAVPSVFTEWIGRQVLVALRPGDRPAQADGEVMQA